MNLYGKIMLFFVININICEDLTEKKEKKVLWYLFWQFFFSWRGVGNGMESSFDKAKGFIKKIHGKIWKLAQAYDTNRIIKDGASVNGKLLPSEKSSKSIIFIFSIKNSFSMQLANFFKLFLFQFSRKKLKKLFHSN